MAVSSENNVVRAGSDSAGFQLPQLLTLLFYSLITCQVEIFFYLLKPRFA